MRRLNISFAILLLLTACAGFASAADQAPEKSSAATPSKSEAAPATLEMAVYSVPKLMEGTLLRDVAKALSQHVGVTSAQADPEKGNLNVTFEPKKTNPDEILKTINGVAKDAKFVSVAPADPKAASHDCGKCPHASSCAGAKKK
jgi:copper chaperone CopZ